jgi:branched-chain amino acid transport system permease protein
MDWVNDIIQGIMTGGLYALFACGLSLMFGVMNVVNLAHGDLAVVGGYVALGVIAVTHVPAGASFLIVVPIMAALGYLVQRTLIQAALDRSVLTTLLVTFGLSVVIENALLQFVNADSHSIGTGNAIISGSFKVSPAIQIGYLPLIILGVAVVVLLGLQYFLSSTRYGRLIRAVADDREAAQRVGRARLVVFVVAAVFCGAAGALVAVSQLIVQPGAAFSVQWTAEMAFAVVIGGIGTIEGPILGTIVYMVLQQTLSAYNAWYLIILGLVAIVIVLFARKGLWGLLDEKLNIRLFPVGYYLWAPGESRRRGWSRGRNTS